MCIYNNTSMYLRCLCVCVLVRYFVIDFGIFRDYCVIFLYTYVSYVRTYSTLYVCILDVKIDILRNNLDDNLLRIKRTSFWLYFGYYLFTIIHHYSPFSPFHSFRVISFLPSANTFLKLISSTFPFFLLISPIFIQK